MVAAAASPWAMIWVLATSKLKLTSDQWAWACSVVKERNKDLNPEVVVIVILSAISGLQSANARRTLSGCDQTAEKLAAPARSDLQSMLLFTIGSSASCFSCRFVVLLA